MPNAVLCAAGWLVIFRIWSMFMPITVFKRVNLLKSVDIMASQKEHLKAYSARESTYQMHR